MAEAEGAEAAFLEKEEEEAEVGAQAAAQDDAEAAELRKSNSVTATDLADASQLRQTKSSLYQPVEGVRDGAYVLDLLRNGKNALARLTPRAVEACAREGIKHEELLVRPLEAFRGLPTEGVRERHAVKRHERLEEARVSKLDLVSATRLQLVEEGWPPTEEQQIAAAADSGTVAERRRRSEKQAAALQRRGEKSEEMRQQREELEAFALARSRLNEKRKKMMDEERQAQLEAQ